MRSVYKGNMAGGTTAIGEGLSSGFRWDYEISENSGIAIGAEQLIHFDSFDRILQHLNLHLLIRNGFKLRTKWAKAKRFWNSNAHVGVESDFTWRVNTGN